MTTGDGIYWLIELERGDSGRAALLLPTAKTFYG